MYYRLLGRCLIIIVFYFIIHPENVSSETIDGKPKSNGLGDRPDGINEEQRRKLKLWPRGVIQYFIDDFSFDKVLRDKIRTFLEDVSMKTAEALQFMELPYPPKDEGEKWVLFINRIGQLDCADCSTANFSDQGVQKVLLGYDCLNEGNGGLATIVLALAGVQPQHNAPNRNNYIMIADDNILSDKKHLFTMIPQNDWVFSSFDYDFASASHYDFYKYTSNGQATIKPLETLDIPVGDPTGLSPTDIEKIIFLYQNSKADLRPGMKEDCSKLYKPGNNNDLSSETLAVKDENHNSKLHLKMVVEGPSGYKRGLKNIIEKGTDYDTDKANRKEK